MAVKTYKLKKNGENYITPHFKIREFACPDGTDKILIDQLLPLWLEALYYKLGASKAIITSGYRTPEYSVKIGGTATDKHTQGMAADIVYYDKDGKVIPPETVCTTAEDLGFIGGVAKINDRATHIDTRPMSSKYWGDESTGSTSSIWNQKKGCYSFYDWFKLEKKKETLVKYKVKKTATSRTTPFKLSDNKAVKHKKDEKVKVVKGGRVEYGGYIFYKIKYNGIYYWLNKKYLTK